MLPIMLILSFLQTTHLWSVIFICETAVILLLLPINDQVYPNNAGTMMDRNLGATSATPGDIGAFGLLYQWGRKDPFMGACAKSGTTLAASTGSWNTVTSPSSMDYAEENPTTFIKSNWTGGSVPGNGWHTSESVKGLYDPCPAGYRVPDGGDNGFWATALGTSSNAWNSAIMKWTNNGFTWTICILIEILAVCKN